MFSMVTRIVTRPVISYMYKESNSLNQYYIYNQVIVVVTTISETIAIDVIMIGIKKQW